MKQFSEQLHYAMTIRKMTQADIVRATGISKSSISTYLSGAFVPKQNNIYKLAKALNVSEAWLLGYDVPMERTVELRLTSHEQDVIIAYRNQQAMQPAVDRLLGITTDMEAADLEIEAEVESYRQELLAEKKGENITSFRKAKERLNNKYFWRKTK